MPSAWREQIAALAVAERPGPSVEDLQRRKHRIAQAYADDGLSEAEYKEKLAEVDRQLRQVA